MSYSVFIKILKYSLLALSIIIVFLVIYNNNFNKEEKVSNEILFEEKNFQSITQVLQNPTFLGIDKKEQPFKVMAQKATRFKKSPEIFNLEKPTGEIDSGNQKFYLEGDEGIFNKEIQQLYVKGNVKLNDENNMEFNTSEIYFDFKKEILLGEKKVEGKKENSYIVSEGFRILENGEKIFFTGKTKLILANNPNEKP